MAQCFIRWDYVHDTVPEEFVG